MFHGKAPMSPEATAPVRKFRLLTDTLIHAMRSGAMKPGDRLPSVRALCRIHQLSTSTVRRVLEDLEAAGLIEAQPRRGYFVLEPRMPSPSPSASRPQKVAVAPLALRLFDALRDSHVAPFGSPFIEPAWLDLDRVNYHLRQAARRFSPERGLRDLPPGSDALRQQIARRALHQGVTLDWEETVITCGAMEALNLALRAVARPGDVIAVESPTFYGLLHAIENNGMQALEIRTDPARGIDLDELDAAIPRHNVAACLLMPSLQNPLGFVMREADKQRLIDILERHRIPLIEDDAYRELAFSDVPYRPVKHYDRSGRVLYCSTFSKAFSPGPRIGWLAAGRYYRETLLLKLMGTLATPIPNQMAVASYLQHEKPDRRLAQLRRRLSGQLARLADEVERHFPPGTRVSRPAGGYVLWAALPDNVDTLAAYDATIADGMSYVPGTIFSPSGRFGHCLRLNGGFDFDRDALARLARLGRRLTTG